jgi:hypothetical protein
VGGGGARITVAFSGNDHRTLIDIVMVQHTTWSSRLAPGSAVRTNDICCTGNLCVGTARCLTARYNCRHGAGKLCPIADTINRVAPNCRWWCIEHATSSTSVFKKRPSMVSHIQLIKRLGAYQDRYNCLQEHYLDHEGHNLDSPIFALEL